MENTEKQHLELIARMIQSARKEYNDDSYIYLLWGWAVTLAALIQYVLLRMNSPYYAAGWVVLPVVAVIQVVMQISRKKKNKVTTQADKIISYVWIADGVCMGIVLVSANVMQMSTYPVLMLLYGIGTFISGSIMNFKPMQLGAVCCWALAIPAFRVSFEMQSLLLPLSLILSYIIPGYLLRKRFRKNV
jgi:hypothetical protein